MLTSVNILGVQVRSGAVHDVVEHIDRRVEHRDTTRVAFLNAHLSNTCSRQAPLRERLGSFLVLNDGVGLDIARRVLHGRPFSENLNGTDFVSAYLDRTEHDLRIFLLGARREVVGETAAAVSRRWPRHTVVGFHHGYLGSAEEAEVSERIARSKPDLVLVGMGNPRQEQWIAANIPGVCACGMAVGAWFDFVADVIPRAPGWLRAIRMEWVFRLLREPRRLAGRYLIGNVVFLSRLGAARLRPGAVRG